MTHTSLETTPEQLATAETASLLLALVEYTGCTDYLARWGSYIKGSGRDEAQFPDDIAEQIRSEFARQVIGTTLTETRMLDDLAFRKAVFNAAFGRNVPESQQALLLKEMGLVGQGARWSGATPTGAQRLNVVIIGAGLSGIALALQLKRLGIQFEILERNPAVGGTWLVNTYPGCGVDIASHCYSFSKDTLYAWEHYFAKQPEILEYLRRCADEAGLVEHVRFGTTVKSARFDEVEQCWIVEAQDAQGVRLELPASVIVSAVGQLSTPMLPDIPGLDTFRGEIIHSAQWRNDARLANRKVILVGGGASANQIGPAIAPEVAHLTVVQRSAHWMMGVPHYHRRIPEGERWVLQNFPAYARWYRARTVMSMTDAMRAAVIVDPAWSNPDGTINAMNQQVRERLVAYIRSELGGREDLIEKNTPRHAPFVKRMLRDNGWYRMMLRDNVTLVSSGIDHFTETGLVDKDGQHHEADAVVFATGFQAARMLGSAEILGRNAQSIRDVWGDDDPRAYLGMAVPGFPNMFVMYGPNTNIGTGGSIFFVAECQATYIATMLKNMVEQDLRSIEVRDGAYRQYNEQLDRRLSEMVWSQPNAESWYRNSQGRVITNMPWSSLEYWELTQAPKLDDYDLHARRLSAD